MTKYQIQESRYEVPICILFKVKSIIPTLSRIQVHAHWSQLIFSSLLRSLKYVCFYMSSTEFLAIIYPFWPCRHLCCMSINIWSKIERNIVLMEFYCLQSDFWKKSNTRAKLLKRRLGRRRKIFQRQIFTFTLTLAPKSFWNWVTRANDV